MKIVQKTILARNLHIIQSATPKPKPSHFFYLWDRTIFLILITLLLIVMVPWKGTLDLCRGWHHTYFSRIFYWYFFYFSRYFQIEWLDWGSGVSSWNKISYFSRIFLFQHTLSCWFHISLGKPGFLRDWIHNSGNHVLSKLFTYRGYTYP